MTTGIKVQRGRRADMSTATRYKQYKDRYMKIVCISHTHAHIDVYIILR